MPRHLPAARPIGAVDRLAGSDVAADETEVDRPNPTPDRAADGS